MTRRYKYTLKSLLSATALAALLLWATESEITVVQLSASNLSKRFVTHYEWMGGIIKTSPAIADKATDISDYLIYKGWSTPVFGRSAYVDVVMYSSWGRSGRGPAKLIYSRIYRDHSGLAWVQWSKEHPLLAKELWPNVLKLIEQDQLEEAFFLLGEAGEIKTTPREVP